MSIDARNESQGARVAEENVVAVYARYYGRYVEKFEGVPEAIRFLRSGNEDGELFPLGVYDAAANTIYVPDSEPAGVEGPDYRLEEVRSACELSEGRAHVFGEVEEFALWPDNEE